MKCEVNLLRVFASVMFVEARIKRKVVLFFYKGVMECVLLTCHSVTSQTLVTAVASICQYLLCNHWSTIFSKFLTTLEARHRLSKVLHFSSGCHLAFLHLPSVVADLSIWSV